MKSEQFKNAGTAAGAIFRKVLESATHAAIFAYVSKKVSKMMDAREEKTKIRIEENPKEPKISTTRI